MLATLRSTMATVLYMWVLPCSRRRLPSYACCDGDDPDC